MDGVVNYSFEIPFLISVLMKETIEYVQYQS